LDRSPAALRTDALAIWQAGLNAVRSDRLVKDSVRIDGDSLLIGDESIQLSSLDRIAVGTERLLQRQSTGVLTVSTSPDFAAKWLVHRLGHFAEANTGIDLRVSATLHHVDFAREEVDLAVRHGDGNWPGLDTGRLCAEQLFAVCSPKLLSRRRRLDKPADVLKFPLIHLDSRADWTNWLQAVGLGDRLISQSCRNTFATYSRIYLQQKRHRTQ